MRASVDDFLNLDITLKQTICNTSGFIKLGMLEVVIFLNANPESKIVIFFNSKAKYVHYVSELERKLDEGGVGVDVMYIHGGLNKHDKFWRIRIFCGNHDSEIEELNTRGLLTTSAANDGIDNHILDYCIRFEFMRDLCTYIQEVGRGSQQRGRSTTFIFMTTLQSYDFLVQ